MGTRNRLRKSSVTMAGVRSYDELMEGGIFLVEVHIVQKGDTLWKISRHYGISFDELKRVNAHLANPDYVVPGMKIFLPEKSTKTGTESAKAPNKGAGTVKKTEKEPIKVAPTPVEKVKAPVQQKPVQEKPVQPKPKAPAQQKPKAPEVNAPSMPVPPVQQAPQAQQAPQMPPMQPMQPMQQQMPFVGVPCGWMPIFDADCFPFVQPGHMQQPIPMSAPQLPVELESSSSIEKSVRPAPKPVRMRMPAENTMPDGWKLLESSDLRYEKGDGIKKAPSIHFEESSFSQVEAKGEQEKFAAPTPPQYQMPMAQEMPMQGGWQHGQQYAQQAAYPAYPQAGCGQGQAQPYHQMHHCGGCGQYHPMPPQMQPVNHCNACNQPIQAMPGQMMPYPTQQPNWPGNN